MYQCNSANAYSCVSVVSVCGKALGSWSSDMGIWSSDIGSELSFHLNIKRPIRSHDTLFSSFIKNEDSYLDQWACDVHDSRL